MVHSCFFDGLLPLWISRCFMGWDDDGEMCKSHRLMMSDVIYPANCTDPTFRVSRYWILGGKSTQKAFKCNWCSVFLQFNRQTINYCNNVPNVLTPPHYLIVLGEVRYPGRFNLWICLSNEKSIQVIVMVKQGMRLILHTPSGPRILDNFITYDRSSLSKNQSYRISITIQVAGWWFQPTPLKKSWTSSVGARWHSQYDGKVIIQSCSKPPTSDY